jgi:hypothetical protein
VIGLGDDGRFDKNWRTLRQVGRQNLCSCVLGRRLRDSNLDARFRYFHACTRYSYDDLGSWLGLGYLGFWLGLASATSDSLSLLKENLKRLRASD